MRFARTARSDRLLAVEITPMVDVVFLLIIFFMTTARFVQVTRAELDLPQEAGEQQETAEEAGLVVNVDRAGAIIVDGSPLTITEFEQLLARTVGRRTEPARVLLRADRACDSARLNAIIRLLRANDVGVARLATEVPR